MIGPRDRRTAGGTGLLFSAVALVLAAFALAVSCFPASQDEAAKPRELVAEEAGARVPTKPTCKGSLQAKIDAASPGDTVRLAGECVYRESVTVNKPLILRGHGEIRGSDVWDQWTRSGPRWTSEKTVPNFSMLPRFRCMDGTEACLWPEQVFVDGEPLKQVLSDPKSGQFALEEDKHVVLGEDPDEHIIEVTVRANWVRGAASGVTISGITMKHAAIDGIWNGGYPDFTVEDNDLSWAHVSNIKLTLAAGLLARDNDLHHGGQLGLASNDAEIEVIGNRVYDNNTEGYEAGWEAGGMKISQPTKALISENQVHDNRDIGIWVDTVNPDQSAVEIAHNEVHHQPWQGIRVELTKNFDVHDNVVWENGWGRGDSYDGCGISVDGSFDGIVSDNVLAWNASGIGVVQQDRSRPEEGPYQTTKNVRLAHNKVIQNEIPGSSNHAAIYWNSAAGAVAEGAPSIYDPSQNNRGANNVFWFDEPEGRSNRFKWDSQIRTLAAYNSTPAEQGGRYLSNEEKNDLLQKFDLLGASEPHPTEVRGLVSSIMGWLQGVLR